MQCTKAHIINKYISIKQITHRKLSTTPKTVKLRKISAFRSNPVRSAKAYVNLCLCYRTLCI